MSIQLVVGDKAVSFLTKLSNRLRERTKRECERLDKRRYKRYSPWMCIRPVLDRPIKESILLTQYPEQGELITDRAYLEAVDRFLGDQGQPLMQHMPVEPSAWPVMTDIKEERPDAVSAFAEGRALLRCSSFLEKLYPALVDFVVPQRREKPSGFDSSFARGVIFRTFPQQGTGLLAGFQIAHAMGHHAALLLHSVDPVIEPSERLKVISYEVRNDKRTADHAMVSAVAIAYMCILARDLYGEVAAPYIADTHVSGYGLDLKQSLFKAVRSIRTGVRTTAVGTQVLDELLTLATPVK